MILARIKNGVLYYRNKPLREGQDRQIPTWEVLQILGVSSARLSQLSKLNLLEPVARYVKTGAKGGVHYYSLRVVMEFRARRPISRRHQLNGKHAKGHKPKRFYKPCGVCLTATLNPRYCSRKCAGLDLRATLERRRNESRTSTTGSVRP